MRISRAWIEVAALALATSMLGGCYADADFPPDVVDYWASETDDAYVPTTFDNDAIYTDAFGRPYCFVNGHLHFLPASYAAAARGYRGYYGYRGFYGDHGADGYRGYQGPHGYHGYPSYHPATPAPVHR